jgi:hypothetical protein
MITRDSGEAYATGMNSCFQLGLGTSDDVFTPTKVDTLSDSIILTYAA